MATSSASGGVRLRPETAYSRRGLGRCRPPDKRWKVTSRFGPTTALAREVVDASRGGLGTCRVRFSGLASG
jgi:hypothetical protein